MIENLIKNITDLWKAEGFNLWFGGKDSYNGNRNWSNKDIILEPFQIPLDLDSACFWETEWTLWILIGEEYGGEQLQTNDKKLDYLREQALLLINILKEEDYIVIPKKLYELPVDYYDADSNITTNNQSVLKLTFPVQIYKENV